MKKLIIFALIIGTIYFGLPVFFNRVSAEENYSIRVTYPNGGEQFTTLHPITVTWTQSDIDSVLINFISDDQPNSASVNISVPVNNTETTGSYTIPISALSQLCNNCRVQLRGYKTNVGSIIDQSDNTFTISSGQPTIKMFSEEIPSQNATAGQTNVTFSRKKIKSLNNQSNLFAIFIRLYTTDFNNIAYAHPELKVVNLKLINEKTGQEYPIDGTLGQTLADKITFTPQISIQENEEIYFKLVGDIPSNYGFEGPNTGKFYGYMSAIEPGSFYGYTNSEVESNPMYTTKTVTSNTPTTCTSWTYSNWNACTNGTQTRTIISQSPSGCTGGNPVLTQSCNSTPTTCTSWNYSAWGSCTNNQQTRTITSSSPNNCIGGSPVLTQSCSNGVDLIVSNIAINLDSAGNHIRVIVKNIGSQNLVMNQSVILKLTFGTNISEIQSCNTTGSMSCAVGNKYNAGIAINAYGKSTLAPGEEYSITFDNGTYLLEKVEFNNNTNYLIRAMVDWTDMIEESNENNNTLTKSHNIASSTSWTTGQWIKTDDSSTVYFLDNNNIRHSYPNEKIWYSYFNNDFSFVKTVTKDNLASYSLGKNVPYKSGALIKIPSVPKVYKVGDDGVMQWIKTENTAKTLYGDNWNKLVHDLDESSFNDYTEGASLE